MCLICYDIAPGEDVVFLIYNVLSYIHINYLFYFLEIYIGFEKLMGVK